jgi:hypothetical protein
MKKLITQHAYRFFLPILLMLVPGVFTHAKERFESTTCNLENLDVAERLAVDPDVITLINQLDHELVLDYLEDILSFGPRVTNTSPCDRAAEYILDEFQAMGLDAGFHEWIYGSYSGKNVVATLPGTGISNEIFIICGHYDSVTNCPGADDNATGTAAVLACANLMSKASFKRTIRFVIFSGEEQGLLGSKRYAEQAKANGDNIGAVLNGDMFGYADTPANENMIRVYADTASLWLQDFTEDVHDAYAAYIGDHTIMKFTGGPSSDHKAFWEQGYNAVFYWEYEKNPNYHLPTDTIAFLNMDYVTKNCKLLLATLAELAIDADMHALYPDGYTLNGSSADSINFTLSADAANGDRNYILLAGVSGTGPGTPLPGGHATLPLNWDVMTDLVIQNLNSPVFSGFLGKLDPAGRASAQLNTFGPLPASAVGARLYFAFACNNFFDYVSNPVAIEVVD